MDGTRFKMRMSCGDEDFYGICCRRGKQLIFSCDGDEEISQAYFSGDEFVAHGCGDTWKISSFVPLTEAEKQAL